MRQDGECFAFVMLFLLADQGLLAVGIVPQAHNGGFGKGPREMGIADFLARGAHACAGGCFRTLDQATRRGEVLHPWEAVKVMDVIEQHEAEDCANARHGLHQVQGVGVVLLGACDDGETQITEQLIIIGDQGQVDLDILVHSGIVKALGDALATPDSSGSRSTPRSYGRRSRPWSRPLPARCKRALPIRGGGHQSVPRRRDP